MKDWLEQGIVHASISDYALPIVLVREIYVSLRLCVNYRGLNRKMVKDRFPLPVIKDVLDKLQTSKIFATLDLRNGSFHVDVDKDISKNAAFVTHQGQYELL